jgi:hypothetical protein
MIDAWLDLPDWQIVAVLLVAFTFSGILCVAASFHPAARTTAETYKGVVAPFFASSSMLFALMTAFLGNAVRESMRSANQAVMMERDGLVRIITLAEAQPNNPAIWVLPDQARAYVRSVLADEWPLPPGRDHAPQTEAALRQMFTTVAHHDMAVLGGNAVQAAFLRALEEISAGRIIRLGLSRPDADNLRWMGVLLLGLLTQLSIAAVHLDRARAQVLALLLSTAGTVTALGVVATTERPFSGLLTVSRAPFEHVLTPDP